MIYVSRNNNSQFLTAVNDSIKEDAWQRLFILVNNICNFSQLLTFVQSLLNYDSTSSNFENTTKAKNISLLFLIQYTG